MPAPLPVESDAESVAEEIPHKAEPAKAESADTKMKDEEEEEEEEEEDGEEVLVLAQVIFAHRVLTGRVDSLWKPC